MKPLLILLFLTFSIWSWAATELEVNGKEYTVHLDEHVKPYMANRILHTVIFVKEEKKSDAERKLSEILSLSPEQHIDYSTLLPKELFFTTDTERHLIRLSFHKEKEEFTLYFRMILSKIDLVDVHVTQKAEPAVMGNG